MDVAADDIANRIYDVAWSKSHISLLATSMTVPLSFSTLTHPIRSDLVLLSCHGITL
ncbi:hypothetical protein PIB30_105632, partial [Stylosanthes scabra]|nr:hypothetical protein [Stylosanthes scabra]